jgi:hypothetical protein
MQSCNLYTSTTDCINKIVKTEGFFALYKGFNLTLMNTFLTAPIYITTLETQKQNLAYLP